MAGIELERLSYAQFRRYAEHVSKLMLEDGFYPDVIVAVLRGGAGVARAVSDIIGQTCITAMRCEFYDDIGKTMDRPRITQDIPLDVSGRNVLVCDDVSDSGRSMKLCIDHIAGKNPRELKTATIYIKPGTIFVPDYYAALTEKWIVFPGEEYETIRKLMRRGKESTLLKYFSREEIQKAMKFRAKELSAANYLQG